MTTYHYKECGLDNVIIEGVMPCHDDDGDDVVTIPNVPGLHCAIAASIVAHGSGISGSEFSPVLELRKENQKNVATVTNPKLRRHMVGVWGLTCGDGCEASKLCSH